MLETSILKIKFLQSIINFLVILVLFSLATESRRNYGGTKKYSSVGITRDSQIYKRSRLCPTNDNGPPFRFHRETKMCYKIGDQGPCGELMEFTLVDGDYGTCDCSQAQRCGRPLIYWPETKRCYFVNDQGPCSAGKWLVFGIYKNPVCKRNPCRGSESDNPSRGSHYWVEHLGKCYKVGSQGYCSSNEILLNEWKSYRPSCFDKNHNLSCLNGQVPKVECLPGMKIDYLEKCMIKKYKKQVGNKITILDMLPNIYHLTLE